MDINDVIERLTMACSLTPGTWVEKDVGALLADHARLNELLGNSEQLAPAIDLEQVRMLAQGSVDALAQNKVYPADVSAAIGSMRHLLALIDGQASVRSSSEHSSEVAAGLVTDDAARRLVRAMENTPGDELIEPNTRLCRRLLAAALQPTKGEGVAGD